MKSKLLFIFFGILVLVGMGATVYFGMKPKPIPKIRLSSFEKPLKFAQAIELRMREEINKSPLLLFGYQPERPEQLEVIKEFIKINFEPQMAYETIVIEERLPEDLKKLFPQAEIIDSRDRTGDLAAGLQMAIEQKHRVLVILPSVYSSQILSGSVADLLKKNFHLPITSFSIVEMIRQRENERSVLIPCFVTDSDPTGAGALGCAILQQSRSQYRKKMASGKRVGMMDQRGATDYLIFYSNAEEAL